MNSNPSESLPSPRVAKPRLAIIDNDSLVLRDLFEFFSSEGYDVSTFRSSRHQQISNIVEQVAALRPHIVILDLRLFSQADEYDLTGLTILRDLLSARCILYSAFITTDVLDEAEKAITPPELLDCYSGQTKVYRAKKTRSPADLIELANQLARTMSSACNDVVIRHPPTWNLAQMISVITEKGKQLPEETLADLLVQLYPNSRLLTLNSIDGALQTEESASQGRSIVLKVYPEKFEAGALKVTHTEDALHECEKYSKHIKGKLGGNFYATLERFVVFWDVAGSVYHFIGSSETTIATFMEHYQLEADSARILAPLTHLFGTVWNRLYNERQPAIDANLGFRVNCLFDLYDHNLGLRNRLSRLLPDEPKIFSRILQKEITNPAWWLARHGEDYVLLPTTHVAVVHGDLHSENLYVHDEYAWVIDFERTGIGHILQDVTELEVDIVTRLIPTSLDTMTLNLLMRAIVAPRSLREELPSLPQIDASGNAQKALRVINGMRQIARNATGFQDQREYLWGLLFDATFIATRRKIDSIVKDRAILFASIIADRLQTWNHHWRIDDPSLHP